MFRSHPDHPITFAEDGDSDKDVKDSVTETKHLTPKQIGLMASKPVDHMGAMPSDFEHKGMTPKDYKTLREQPESPNLYRETNAQIRSTDWQAEHDAHMPDNSAMSRQYGGGTDLDYC